MSRANIALGKSYHFIFWIKVFFFSGLVRSRLPKQQHQRWLTGSLSASLSVVWQTRRKL